MKKVDFVIILGGGTDGSLTPVLYTKERLTGFIKRRKLFINTPIILSGGYSVWFTKKPKYTEAQVMRNFLIKRGFSHRLLFIEDRSRDTIGNAYFSKQIIKRFAMRRNILIVTTKGHADRSKWIFKKVFGKKYKFDFWEVPSFLPSFANNPGRRAYEHYLIKTYKWLMGGAVEGDDNNIYKLMKKLHPAYSNSKGAKMIREFIIAAKQKYLGYTKLKT